MLAQLEIPPLARPLPPVFGPDKPWLAPLAGYSDLPFRLLCRSYGAAVCETEMISAKGLFHQARRTLDYLRTIPEDAPLVTQIFGSDPESVGAAARKLREANYLYLDFNAGCSVRKVFKQGAGAALLADKKNFLAIAKALIEAARAEDGKPRGMAGFKLRLGVDSREGVMPDLGLALEDLGADWLALHPRSARDHFAGEADWRRIEELASRVSIPVLASGDLFAARDGLECLRQTGAAGVMYARGALHNPRVFAEHKALALGEAIERGKEDLIEVISRHASLARAYGPERGALAKTRSLIPRYAREFPGVGQLRRALCEAREWSDVERVAREFFAA